MHTFEQHDSSRCLTLISARSTHAVLSSPMLATLHSALVGHGWCKMNPRCRKCTIQLELTIQSLATTYVTTCSPNVCCHSPPLGFTERVAHPGCLGPRLLPGLPKPAKQLFARFPRPFGQLGD